MVRPPDPIEALSLALSHVDSVASLVLAEIEHMRPEHWPGTLARLGALARDARDSVAMAGAALRLLDGGAAEAPSPEAPSPEATPAPTPPPRRTRETAEAPPSPPPPPRRTRETTVVLRADGT